SPASGNDGGAEVSSKEGNEVTSEISKEIGGVVEELNAADGSLSVGGKMASESEVSVSLSEYRIVNDKEDLISREMSLPPEVEKEKNSYAEVVSEGSTPSLVPEFTVVDGVADIEIPVELGKSVAAEPTKGKEVVLKLLDDLEKGVVNPGSARVATGASKKHVEVGSSGLSVSQKEGEWRLNGRPASPRRINLTVPGRGVESLNGFQVLGNIREEGEIVDDVDCVQDPSIPQIEEVEVVERSEAAQASTMHLPGQKNRGKGGRGRL
ncbi:hypothetical protein HID58_090693, partial [Brassica napus]